MAEGERKEGLVIRVVADKGFGFIKGDDGIERFFHKSAVVRETGASFADFQEGKTRVHFTDGVSNKGPRAEDVVAR